MRGSRRAVDIVYENDWERWKKRFRETVVPFISNRRTTDRAKCLVGSDSCTWKERARVFALAEMFLSVADATIAIHALRFPAYIARCIIILSTRRWIGKLKKNFLENRSWWFKPRHWCPLAEDECPAGSVWDYQLWGIAADGGEIDAHKSTTTRSEIPLNFEDDMCEAERKKARNNLLVDTHE